MGAQRERDIRGVIGLTLGSLSSGLRFSNLGSAPFHRIFGRTLARMLLSTFVSPCVAKGWALALCPRLPWCPVGGNSYDVCGHRLRHELLQNDLAFKY